MAENDGSRSLVFFVVLSNLREHMQERWWRLWVKTLMYTDDIVTYGDSLFQMNQAIRRIVTSMGESDLSSY